MQITVTNKTDTIKINDEGLPLDYYDWVDDTGDEMIDDTGDNFVFYAP